MMTSCITLEQINKINNLAREIEKLTDVEKLFLYLQLPCGLAGVPDELEATSSKSTNLPPRLNGNILTRKLDQETTQTYTWILSHLEVDQSVSLPKQEVYDEYKSFCQANRFEPLCVADFGKAMKHTFPCIKPRRLGHRGNSRYCYSGLRKKYKILAPSWPEMSEEPATSSESTSMHQSDKIILNGSGNSSTLILNGKPDLGPISEVSKPEDRTSHHNMNGIEMMRNIVSQKQCSGPHQSQVCTNLNMDVVQNRQASSNDVSTCPLPTNIASVSRNEPMFSCNQPYFNYNYPQTILQPGTPDDDDYQHNYQHKEGSINRQFMSKPALIQVPITKGVSCKHLYQRHQQQPPSQPNAHQNDIQAGYSRVLPVVNTSAGTGMVPTSTTAHHQSHDPMLPQTSFCPDNPALLPSSSSSTSTPTTNMSTYMSLSRLSGGPHMETYASPFQSPASTPYPSTSSNYMNHDSQDYFACEPMQHYTSS